MLNERTEVVHCRLTKKEADLLKQACQRHHVNVQEMLHAIIVDALVDEENVRRREQERCQAS